MQAQQNKHHRHVQAECGEIHVWWWCDDCKAKEMKIGSFKCEGCNKSYGHVAFQDSNWDWCHVCKYCSKCKDQHTVCIPADATSEASSSQ